MLSCQAHFFGSVHQCTIALHVERFTVLCTVPILSDLLGVLRTCTYESIYSTVPGIHTRTGTVPGAILEYSSMYSVLRVQWVERMCTYDTLTDTEYLYLYFSTMYSEEYNGRQEICNSHVCTNHEQIESTVVYS